MRTVSMATQASLFGRGPPELDADFATMQRIELRDGAWLDVAPGWLSGHAQLFEDVLRRTAWRSEERTMYDRTVRVPRQCSSLPPGGARGGPIERMRQALSARYGEEFERVGLALYRDGHDSVAWHGDTVARDLPEALVATVSIGTPRRFLVKPTAGGRSFALSLGWGDLLVMGGTCQRTHRHCVPKVASAGPRIAIMYRPVWKAPRPMDVGGAVAPPDDA